MNTNFKKFMAVLSTAAMLSGLAAPSVLADEVDETAEVEAAETVEAEEAEAVIEDAESETAEAEEIAEEVAELLADDAISSYDFNDLTAGTLLTMGDSGQTYSEIEGLTISIGGRSGGGDTKISITAGKGTDDTNALTIYNGRFANGSRGARFTVDAPVSTDVYKLSMMVMPDASGTNDLSIGTASAPGTTLGLDKGEWSKVEVYVSKVDGEYAVAINGSVVSKATSSNAPTFWGNNAENSGNLYVDDIVMTAATSVPNVDPTPTPIPAYVGYTNDFESAKAGTLISMTQVASTPYAGFGGSVLTVPGRNGGAVPGNNWTIISSGGNPGQALQLNTAGTADSSRSARAELIAPSDAAKYDGKYKVSFDVKPGASQDLYINDSASSHGGTALNLAKDWQTVTIYMFDNTRVVMAGDTFGCMASTTSLPVLWGENKNDAGSITFDNYAISEVTNEEIVTAIAQAVEITDSAKTVYKEDGVYKFINSASLPDTSCGTSVSWSVGEKSGDEVVDTTDVSISKGKLQVNNRDASKTYVLTATVSKYGITKSKEFELKAVTVQDMLAIAADEIDFTNGTVVEKRGTDEEGIANFTVRDDFELPTSAWQASVAWSLKDDADSKFVSFDDTTAKITFSDAATVTLVATLSYAGETYEREYKLVLDNQYNNIVAKVSAALESPVIYPAGNDGQTIDPITLSETTSTLISTDIAYKSAVSAEIISAYTVPNEADRAYMSNDGVISVRDKDAHNITLRRTVSYVSNGKTVYSATKDYPVTVQFDTEAVEKAAETKAEAYAKVKVEEALAADSTLSESKQEKVAEEAKNAAMNILCDKYKVRFDAKYDGNFSNIPDSVDDDFTLPTKGYFGSEITWGSSDTSIKINGENAKVTQPTSDKNVQLKATFTSGAAAEANAYSTTVTVEGTGKSSSRSSGGSSSGGGNSYRGSLGTSAYTAVATPEPVAPNAGVIDGTTVDIQSRFKDLLDVQWAAEAIEALAEKGIVSGKEDTRFAPNDNITRAELSKIIVGAFGIETGAAADFSDVAADAWYAPFVGACAAAGIVTGYEDGTFKPDNLVTRQEMAVMVKRAADYKGIAIDTPNAKADFTDEASIASYAADAVETLQRAGIINGMENGAFAPTATATRAQAAKILYNFCK